MRIQNPPLHLRLPCQTSPSSSEWPPLSRISGILPHHPSQYRATHPILVPVFVLAIGCESSPTINLVSTHILSRCGSPNCAAHNFGRNLACIGCGYPRPSSNSNRTPSPHSHSPIQRLHPQPQSGTPSPRFNSAFNVTSNPMLSHSPHSPYTPSSPLSPHPTLSQAPARQQQQQQGAPLHHLLTPSGRAFASGGKVQNLSSDPLAPCVMYWPDNEALPEQGQIRRNVVTGVPVSPISPRLPNRGHLDSLLMCGCFLCSSLLY